MRGDQAIVVTTISTTETAATAGSMLSCTPIHIRRGSVMALTLVMNKRNADLVPGQHEGQQRGGDHAEPDVRQNDLEHPLRDGRAQPARGEVDAPIELRELDEDEHHREGTIITTCAMTTPIQVS